MSVCVCALVYLAVYRRRVWVHINPSTSLPLHLSSHKQYLCFCALHQKKFTKARYVLLLLLLLFVSKRLLWASYGSCLSLKSVCRKHDVMAETFSVLLLLFALFPLSPSKIDVVDWWCPPLLFLFSCKYITIPKSIKDRNNSWHMYMDFSPSFSHSRSLHLLQMCGMCQNQTDGAKWLGLWCLKPLHRSFRLCPHFFVSLTVAGLHDFLRFCEILLYK
jgi:hypothetical protein